MVDENALPSGRWFLGDFRSTDFQDRQRIGRLEPCKGSLVVDPGEGGSALNFSLTAFGLPIATLDVADAISTIAKDDVHLVPVQIRGYGEFRFVQCLRALDCVDETRSTFETFDIDAPINSMRGNYSDFSKLVIDPSRVPANAHMFHVSRWRVRPIISSAIMRALIQAGNLGVAFINVSE
jgi:hypothetical protein